MQFEMKKDKTVVIKTTSHIKEAIDSFTEEIKKLVATAANRNMFEVDDTSE